MSVEEILNTRNKKNITDLKSNLNNNEDNNKQTQSQVNQDALENKESHEHEEIIISGDFPLDLGSL